MSMVRRKLGVARNLIMACGLVILLGCTGTEPPDSGSVDYVLARHLPDDTVRVRMGKAHFFVYDYNGDPAVHSLALVLVLGDSLEFVQLLDAGPSYPAIGTFSERVYPQIYHRDFPGANLVPSVRVLQIVAASNTSVEGSLLVEYRDASTGELAQRLGGTFRAVPHLCGAWHLDELPSDCRLR